MNEIDAARNRKLHETKINERKQRNGRTPMFPKTKVQSLSELDPCVGTEARARCDVSGELGAKLPPVE